MMNLPPLIGLTGHAGAGKDAAAALLSMLGYERRAFADHVRSELLDIFLTNDPESAKHIFIKPTPSFVRKTLQDHGQFRRSQDPSYWINLLFTVPLSTLTVISDVRYQNEIDAVHERGGIVWRIERPGAEGAHDLHESEAGQKNLTGVNATFVNDGTLIDLASIIREMLNLYASRS